MRTAAESMIMASPPGVGGPRVRPRRVPAIRARGGVEAKSNLVGQLDLDARERHRIAYEWMGVELERNKEGRLGARGKRSLGPITEMESVSINRTAARLVACQGTT